MGYIRYIATREGVEVLPGPEGYMEYMATRSGSHGLFSSQPVTDLNAVMKEVSQHTGIVWKLIYSLHREDAARLGFDSAASWRQLIKAHQVELASAMKIPPEQFRWCAAYHDEGERPHIHMTVWSDDPAQGCLTPDGIKAMRSTRELVRQMEDTVCDSPVIETRMLQLARELKTVSGKKVYGYLKKPLKEQIDAIVDELAKVPAVAECYEVWNQLRDELERYYKDKPRQHLPLSQQKEFKAIKNMVIREANDLRLGILTFEDEGMRDESPDNSWFSDPSVSNEDKRSVIELLEQRWEDDGSVSAAYQLSRVWGDGLGVLLDDGKAEMWLHCAAEDGHSGAQYALAKMLHQLGRVDEAVAWYEQAAEAGNQFAAYQFGKLYLLGKDVDQDQEMAEQWFTAAADQGHEYAQFFLDHMEQDHDPSALLCATRLLCSMAQIIRDTPPSAPPAGLRIDRKQFRQLMEKRIAMGHKLDDHEEQSYIGPAV